MSNCDSPGVQSEDYRRARLQEKSHSHLAEPTFSLGLLRTPGGGNSDSPPPTLDGATHPLKPKEAEEYPALGGPGVRGDHPPGRSVAPPSLSSHVRGSPVGSVGNRIQSHGEYVREDPISPFQHVSDRAIDYFHQLGAYLGNHVPTTPDSDSSPSYIAERSRGQIVVPVESRVCGLTGQGTTGGGAGSVGRLSTQPTSIADEVGIPPGDAPIGSIGDANSSDINPPLWGELREGGDAVMQRFIADMYKFMCIPNAQAIRTTVAYDSFAGQNEKLERMVESAREEAAAACREVRNMSDVVTALEQKISLMSDEISVLSEALRGYSPSPKAPRSHSPPARANAVPTKPVPTEGRSETAPATGVDLLAPGEHSPALQETDVTLASGDDFDGSRVSQIRSLGPVVLSANHYEGDSRKKSGRSTVEREDTVADDEGKVQLRNDGPVCPAAQCSRRPHVVGDSQLWTTRMGYNPTEYRYPYSLDIRKPTLHPIRDTVASVGGTFMRADGSVTDHIGPDGVELPLFSREDSRAVVPQLPYTCGNTQRDWEPKPAVCFFTLGHLGVKLSDAFHGMVMGMNDRDDYPFIEDVRGITIRINVGSRSIAGSRSATHLPDSSRDMLPAQTSRKH